MSNYNVTLSELDAYVAMRESVGYFSQQCTLLNPNGPTQFVENKLQNEIFLSYKHSNNIAIDASRQSGITTSLALMALHTATFNANQTIALMSHKFDQAREILARIREYYHSLPDSSIIKPKLLRDNKAEIIFDNNCRIIAVHATTERLRGTGINHLFVDNLAFIDLSKFIEMYGPLFNVYPTGRMVVATTGSRIHPDYIMHMARRGVKYISV